MQERNARNDQTGREAADNRDTRDAREREAREPRDNRENREYRENRENRENRDSRDNRENRDNREQREDRRSEPRDEKREDKREEPRKDDKDRESTRSNEQRAEYREQREPRDSAPKPGTRGEEKHNSDQRNDTEQQNSPSATDSTAKQGDDTQDQVTSYFPGETEEEWQGRLAQYKRELEQGYRRMIPRRDDSPSFGRVLLRIGCEPIPNINNKHKNVNITHKNTTKGILKNINDSTEQGKGTSHIGLSEEYPIRIEYDRQYKRTNIYKNNQIINADDSETEAEESSPTVTQKYDKYKINKDKNQKLNEETGKQKEKEKGKNKEKDNNKNTVKENEKGKEKVKETVNVTQTVKEKENEKINNKYNNGQGVIGGTKEKTANKEELIATYADAEREKAYNIQNNREKAKNIIERIKNIQTNKNSIYTESIRIEYDKGKPVLIDSCAHNPKINAKPVAIPNINDIEQYYIYVDKIERRYITHWPPTYKYTNNNTTIIHHSSKENTKEIIDTTDKREDIINTIKYILTPTTPRKNNTGPTYAEVANSGNKVTLSRAMTQIANGVSLGKRPARRKPSTK